MKSRAAVAALALLAAVAFGSSPASALTISMAASVATNAGNTANNNVFPNGNVTNTSVTGAGGTDTDAQIGDMLNGSTRVFGGLWRDNGNGTSTLNVNYRLTLNMTADPTVVYDLDLTHDLEGVLQRNSPGLFNGSCEACSITVTNVVASIVNAGGGTVSGSLSQATATNSTGTGDAETDILVGASAFTIAGLIGSQTIQVDFAFTATVNVQNNDDCASFRFGIPGPGTALANECEYGTSSSGPGDGHFVTAKSTVTAVPEPGVAVLLGLGLTGLGVAGRKRLA